MTSADGIIFVSGVYWFGVSGLLKNVVDRMTSLWNNGKQVPLLNNKVVAFMSTSLEEGDVSAIAPLMAASTFSEYSHSLKFMYCRGRS
jgi:multimeric flavodoxin WrbA